VKPGWLTSLLTAIVATTAFLALQNVVRDVWQVRTLPERVMEWLLLFVPLDLFERGLQQFGSDAKGIALVGTLVGMSTLLVLIGTLSMRAGWSSGGLLLLVALLWLLTMGVVMPLTGAGFFATRLLVSPVLTSAVYALLFLAYAMVLIGGRVLALRQPIERGEIRGERRALLAGLVGTAASLGIARFAGQNGGAVSSNLPLAVAPTRRPATPARSVPDVVRTPTTVAPMATADAGPTTIAPLATATADPTPAPEPLPEPPPPRSIDRTRDGALTAAGRTPGTLAPRITANDAFYIVTKNAVADPVVDPATWRLIVDGEVGRPMQLDYRTLRALPAVEVIKTLECISNFTAQCHLAAFGCDLISTAEWRGARLADLLELAGGLKPSAIGLACVSIDEFSSGLLVDVARDPETIVAYGMNGQTLPREHGYPARLLVPGRYGMKDPKWLAGIRAVPEEHLGWYEQRNWNKDGIVKTMARIDVPNDGIEVQPGDQQVAGIAYAGDRGIARVEFSTDGGGTWEPTTLLEPPAGKDTMVRWQGTFSVAPSERVSLTVRATDGTGDIQTDQFTLPQPDGATGRHSIHVVGASA
jgi:DMSO/TMAO reductase YedYZ molybdopterin-dependent catalytic subunit